MPWKLQSPLPSFLHISPTCNPSIGHSLIASMSNFQEIEAGEVALLASVARRCQLAASRGGLTGSTPHTPSRTLQFGSQTKYTLNF